MEKMKKVNFIILQWSGEELYDRYLTADYRYEIEYNTIIKTSYWNQTV